MTENIISSGRLNPEIDPVLTMWKWEIPAYLFLGGLCAGILFFSTLFFLLKKEKEFPIAYKFLPLAVPVLINIGLLFLLLDLSHKLYFWRIYTAIVWTAPMSWGAWVLLLFTPLSILWMIYSWNDYLQKLFFIPPVIKQIFTYLKKYQQPVAWILLALSLALGIYTGILLSAFNARPFWNTAILGPLFLVSGLSAAAALITLWADQKEKQLFLRIDLWLIIGELILLLHMFMGLLASSTPYIEAAHMFIGGPFTYPFWIFIIGIGLLIPLIIEFLEIKNRYAPRFLAPMLILFGNLMLRFVFLTAGLESGWY